MEVVRQIGEHQVLVDPRAPCELSLSASALGEGREAGLVKRTKQDILRSLAQGDDYYPLSMHWEVLDKCNLSCPFCYIVGHSNHRLVRFDEMREPLSDLVDAGLLFCTLTGGEVTLHPDFAEIYAFLKRRGVVVEVFTNGLMLDEATIDLFKRLPPSKVEVSIYTLDGKRLRDTFGGPRDAAERVLNSVLKLKEREIPVECKTFLNTLTAAEIGAITSWCSENDVPHYSSSDLTQAYDGDDLSSFRFVEAPLVYLGEGQKNVCFPCGTRNYGCAINAAFELYPCPSIRHRDCYYSLRDLGAAEALRQMKLFIRRFQDEEIQGATCRDGESCRTCIAYATPIRGTGGELLGFTQ